LTRRGNQQFVETRGGPRVRAHRPLVEGFEEFDCTACRVFE
jgi:hypothetical protein